MVSEAEFFEKVQKVLELDARLRSLFAQGKIATQDYHRQRGELNSMLSQIKAEQLWLIGTSVEDVKKALAKIELSRTTGKIGKNQYEGMKRELAMQQNELESKREVIELAGWDDYVKYLRQDMDDNKYKRYRRGLDPRSIIDGLLTKEGDSPPAWVWVTAQLLLIVSLVIGMLSSVASMIVILPVGTLAFIIFFTMVVHKVANLVGIQKATGGKAFKATMMVMLMMFGAILALMLSSYVMPSGTMVSRASWESLVSSLLSLHLLLSLIGLGTLAFSVHITYDTNISKSIATAVLSAVAAFLAFLALSAAKIIN
jgi:hypothetical protein